MAEESITGMECPTCKGHKLTYIVDGVIRADAHPCPDCQGTGKSTQQQEAEALAELAELECPKRVKGYEDVCVGLDHSEKMPTLKHPDDCPDCQGTGRRLPGLSRECKPCDGTGKGVPRGWGTLKDGTCWDCHGTGRIPVSVAEGFLWLVGQNDFHTLYHYPHTNNYGCYWGKPAPVKKGPTALLALFRAVKMAVEAE